MNSENIHHRTRKTTLYRLHIKNSDEFVAENIFHQSKLEDYALTVIDTRVCEFPAIVVYGIFSQEGGEIPDWRTDAELLSGLKIPSLKQIKSGFSVALAIGEEFYAFGYGDPGNRLIREEIKDTSFGLKFAVRAADANTVQQVARKSIDLRGRQDLTFAAGGLQIDAYGIRKYGEVVRRLGASAANINLTFTKNRGQPVRIECGDGIRLPLGVAGSDLVHDIQEVARIAQSDPDPSLAFIEEFQNVKNPETIELLDLYLEEELAKEGDRKILFSPPFNKWESYSSASKVSFSSGRNRSPQYINPEVEDALAHFGLIKDVLKDSLRAGHVLLHPEDGGEPTRHPNVLRWLEVSILVGSSHFVLSENQWFEIGAEYVRTLKNELSRIIRDAPSIILPAWPENLREEDYVSEIVALNPDFIPLDQVFIKTDRHTKGRGNGFEICDALGPKNELIHIKRGTKSNDLSHLFAQGNVSVESLRYDKRASERFKEKVLEIDPSRDIPDGFIPEKVIYAFQPKRYPGKGPLEVENLTLFTQTSLNQAAKILESQQIKVEAVGIPRTP
ncbi:hypothetical protein GTW20_03800 [Nocardiopsis alba]|uniref:Sporadically distributed protein, TIGR04141 family n=1 Tax=Nocardiopsis alba TaxID=53437 RepID=A0A7K2IN57_9ACTN|nr:hypothetical protein [Nocardiopsis alba]